MSTDQKKRATAAERETNKQLGTGGDTREEETANGRERHVSAPSGDRPQQSLTWKQKFNKYRQKPRRRLFPIWLRLVVVLILSTVALGAGLMIGYGVIGDGSPLDALKWDTWQHIIDLVVKET